jgi:hypothetical protein
VTTLRRIMGRGCRFVAWVIFLHEAQALFRHDPHTYSPPSAPPLSSDLASAGATTHSTAPPRCACRTVSTTHFAHRRSAPSSPPLATYAPHHATHCTRRCSTRSARRTTTGASLATSHRATVPSPRTSQPRTHVAVHASECIRRPATALTHCSRRMSRKTQGCRTGAWGAQTRARDRIPTRSALPRHRKQRATCVMAGTAKQRNNVTLAT